MSRYHTGSKQGLYRSRNGIILGVCRGVADYFGFSTFWIRAILIVVFIFSGFWPVVAIYILAALLMKPAAGETGGQRASRGFDCGYRRTCQDAAQRLKRRWRHLEKRLRRMESRVTSREFDWNRRFYG